MIPASNRSRGLLGLLLGLALLLGARPATAQTTHRSRARQDADHRRAEREAQRVESPYKDSHLQPGRRLHRGEGDRHSPETSDRLRFENGRTLRDVEPKPVGPRRKRKAA